MPAVLVHGDVGGVAPVRGAEQGIVAGGHPHLDREEDRVAVGPHPLDHPRAASGPCSRGTPYSISVKRTRRSLAKIRSLRSVALVPEARRAARRDSAGIERGSELAGRRERLQRPVLQHDVVEVGGNPAPRPGRRLGAVALENEGAVRVGKGEELVVVVGVGALLEGVEHLAGRPRSVDPVAG